MTDNLQEKPIGAALQTVCLLFGGPDRIIAVGGKKWRFEDHPYCGPMTVGKNGDPVKEPPESSPFWDAVNLWYAQGKRTQQAGNETWCVWEKPTMRKMRHLGGRHYELVPDDETHNAGIHRAAEGRPVE